MADTGPRRDDMGPKNMGPNLHPEMGHKGANVDASPSLGDGQPGGSTG